MQRGSIPWLAALAGLALFVSGCNGGELSEIELFFNFIRALDPKTVLRIEWSRSLRQPCSNQWNVVVRCKMVSLFGRPVTEIRLQNLNLSGILDAETLCKLPILCVLIFAKNRIRGTVPDSIADCKSLMHLDLSNSLLTGSLPAVALSKLKNLKRFDISDNHYGSTDPQLNREARPPEDVSHGKQSSKNDDNPRKHWQSWMVVLAMGVTFVLLLIFFTKLKAVQAAKDTEITRELALSLSPPKSPHVEIVVEEKAEERHSELVFFIEKHERFGLEELLEASADLRWQGHCSSLYGVRLKNNATFAVKRLKKLQVSFEEFGQTMRKIGNLKHQNILSLVGYNSSKEKKLLIYRFQNNGSLLTLFNDYIEGKRNLPWKLRLSIAIGIARGLNFIYQWPEDGEIIPHGNIKPSNIMLDEKEEPLISEYGIAKFLVSNKARFFNSSSYAAPEKRLTEQADVYSFGVILLELLTGKFAEMQKNGLDLPKWVKAKVREEWTGEVFDKEIEKFEMYGFSLLNISLKCVSELPGDRPSISEVLEKIQEVVTAQEDISSSSTNSVESI
ncbi:unnamed protein product [Coffea canephora]|uniref:Protein kinase domain-containing protein n=1 Tax=Coffea canephora TaxID=49390 RepID=A0A068UZU3_COFCA|nr:unnamed protein product [Coffea canephora]